jgi:tricorn protease
VVFSYGGDLWLASTDGGTARRLTAHPGQEVFARFSPNGEWVAFTGQTSRSTSCRPREANRHA